MRGSAAGFTEWLLFHLWKQNESTGLSCPYVLVPDTIIYRWGRPFFWYFTTHSGELLRKSKNKVSHKFIEQDFLGVTHTSGLICEYLSFQDEGKPGGASRATTHFFTKQSFCKRQAADFIVNREKSLSGLLQKWVEPKGGHNSTPHPAMIKVTWSPLFSVMERRTNKYSVSDPAIDFYDRLATYEGFEFNSEAESLAVSQLVEDLRKICEGMVEHIRTVSGGNVAVTRMILYFKQDENDRLWLMFCGGVQVYDLENSKSKGPESELVLVLPSLALSKHFPTDKHYFELEQNRSPCLSCNLYVKTSEMCPISFELLIKCYENGVDSPPNRVVLDGESDGEGDVSEDHARNEVPRVIRNTVEGITNKRYEMMRGNVKWLMTKMSVCESCYLYYSAYLLYGKHRFPPKPSLPLKHTSSLPTLDELLHRPETSHPIPSQPRSKRATPTLLTPTPVPPTLASATPNPMTPISALQQEALRSYPITKRDLRSEHRRAAKNANRVRIAGRFTARRLPSMMSIYTGKKTPLDQTHSTRASSQASQLGGRLSEMSGGKANDVLASTIRSLKMCLLDGVMPA